MSWSTFGRSRRQPAILYGGNVWLMLALLLLMQPSAMAQEAGGQQEAGEQQEAASLGEALKKGKPGLGLRYRYEFVADDAFDKDAHASTLRTVLSFRTFAYKGFDLFVEAENVAVVGDDLYNNKRASGRGNGVTDRPVVADPSGTEINQAYLRFHRAGTTLVVGRQEILIDDERHVGPVGWRQNHQSFDAFRFVNTSFPLVTLTYAFLNKVNRIFGDSQSMASHLVNGAIDIGDAGTVRLYGYFLDYDRDADARLSTSTYGFEFAGRRPLAAEAAILYEVEYAAQRDAGDNPNRVEADYLHLRGGIGYSRVATVSLGWEVLAGGRIDGQFNTPLATLHKFNGWADKFLATPADGLRDLYLSAAGRLHGFDWNTSYHDFGADTGGADYGRELDLQLLYRTDWQQVFAGKVAFYDPDEFSVDTNKLMLWTAYSF